MNSQILESGLTLTHRSEDALPLNVVRLLTFSA